MIRCLKYIFLLSILSCAQVLPNELSFLELSLEELMKVKVVIAASGFEQKAARAPATVTVITAPEWQAKGARTLSDVLATVPGFHVSKPQADFNHTKFIIRGLSGDGSSRVKLLIDGEPLELIQNGGLPIGFHFLLHNYKRIEVIKGPGSAVYGADAFAGIINLVSYNIDEIPTHVGFRRGSFNTSDIFISGGFAIGESYLQLSADYSKSQDDKNRVVTSDLQSIFDNLFNTSASLTPGIIDEHYEVFNLLAKWQLNNWQLDYFTWRNFDIGTGAGVAQALDPNGSAFMHMEQVKLNYDFSEFISGNLQLTASFKTQQTESYLNVFPSGTTLPIDVNGNVNFVDFVGMTLFVDGFIGTPSPEGDTLTFRLTHTLNVTEQHFLRWEVGYEDQSYRTSESKNFGTGILNGTQAVVTNELTDVTGTDFVYLPNIKRHFYYLSLQDEWQFRPDLLLNLGVRYDNYSDFGSTINPRLGLIWQSSDTFTFKLFAGSAFKSPSFAQLYVRNNPANLGNSSLQAESIDTLETGMNFEYQVSQNLLFSLNLFKYQAKDLVGFVFQVERAGKEAQNVGEQRGKGTEFWLKWKPKNNITVDFNYSNLSATDERGQAIADIPQQMAYVSLNWLINDRWQWTIDGKWIADRDRAPLDLREKLPNYGKVNSKIERFNVIKGLDVAVIINNLFDRQTKDPSNGNIAEDYPLSGRQVILEMNYGF